MSRASKEMEKMNQHPVLAKSEAQSKKQRVKRGVANGGAKSSSFGHRRFPYGQSPLGRGYAVGNLVGKDASIGTVLFCISKEDWKGEGKVIGPCKHVKMKISDIKFDEEVKEEIGEVEETEE